MRLTKTALLLAALLVLSACATLKDRYVEDGYRFLSGAEIKELVSGNTVEGSYINRKGTWTDYHAPNGIVSSIERDGTYLGTWEISGDAICYSYPDEPIRDCIDVAEKDGRYVHFLANGPYSGNLGGEWISVTPGNTEDLPLE